MIQAGLDFAQSVNCDSRELRKIIGNEFDIVRQIDFGIIHHGDQAILGIEHCRSTLDIVGFGFF